MNILQIQNAVSSYFNNTLRESLKYPETYSVNFDYNTSRLTLIPSSRNAELINLIKVVYDLKNKIEQTILQAFLNKNPNITNINLYIIDNNIIITIIQNDTLFSLPEEVILAKLVSEYDVEKLGDVCRINVNFSKACKSDLFWWEIIKLKFPTYYKEKRYYNYDPKELIKGLDYFNRNIHINISNINPKYTSYHILYGGILYTDILYNNYYQTFKYLILENLWLDMDIIFIVDTIINIGKSINFDNDLEIIKFLFKKDPISTKDIVNNMVTSIYGLKLLKELNNLLSSEGKNRILTDEYLQEILNEELSSNHGSNNPEYYEFVSSMLNRPKTDQRYLEDYINSDIDLGKLQKYILSKISTNIDKDLLIQTALDILHRGIELTFVRFYKYFIKRWTNEDIKIFKDIVDRDFRYDDDTVEEFNILFKVY